VKTSIVSPAPDDAELMDDQLPLFAPVVTTSVFSGAFAPSLPEPGVFTFTYTTSRWLTQSTAPLGNVAVPRGSDELGLRLVRTVARSELCSTVVHAWLSIVAGAAAVMPVPSAIHPSSKKNHALRAVRPGFVDPNVLPAAGWRTGGGSIQHKTSRACTAAHTQRNDAHSDTRHTIMLRRVHHHPSIKSTQQRPSTATHLSGRAWPRRRTCPSTRR
jgi:hypothetical protein